MDLEAEHGSRSKLVSRLNKQSLQLRQNVREITDKADNLGVTFEETGIDAIIIDEAHRYKNLPVYTAMSGLKGLPTARSQRATICASAPNTCARSTANRA